MPTETRADRDPLLVVVLVAGALALPMLAMAALGGWGGMGHAGPMAGTGPATGWWPAAWLLPLGVGLALLAGGYVLLRRGTDRRETGDDAMGELRRAYARGDLTDEEFERRRATLRESE